MPDCNIFIEKKILKCTGKRSVKVQISIDTENKIIQGRELDEDNTMKMILLQYTLTVKNKLNKQMQEYGLYMFCEVS